MLHGKFSERRSPGGTREKEEEDVKKEEEPLSLLKTAFPNF